MLFRSDAGPSSATPSSSTPKSDTTPTTKTETPSAPKTDSKSSSDKPVSVVHTKGGDYNVYAKGSDKAADFRKTYAAAKGNFEWEGRKYAKPSSEPSKPAATTSTTKPVEKTSSAPLPPPASTGLKKQDSDTMVSSTLNAPGHSNLSTEPFNRPEIVAKSNQSTNYPEEKESGPSKKKKIQESKIATIFKNNLNKKKKEEKESGSNPMIDFEPKLKKPGTNNTF